MPRTRHHTHGPWLLSLRTGYVSFMFECTFLSSFRAFDVGVLLCCVALTCDERKKSQRIAPISVPWDSYHDANRCKNFFAIERKSSARMLLMPTVCHVLMFRAANSRPQGWTGSGSRGGTGSYHQRCPVRYCFRELSLISILPSPFFLILSQ
jgi:hypothetical protein